MAVFARFNPRGAGRNGVILNAHPNVEPMPWIPLTTTTRSDAQWGGVGRTHRVQPNERGKTFTSSNLAGIGAAPSMSSSGCGCGGGCGANNKLPLTGVNKKA
jgi:hypothetical protein